MTHEQLLSNVLDQYKGTPEEFGELLHDATMTIPEWVSRESRRKYVERKSLAKWKIRRLDGGEELLKRETNS